VLDVLRSLFAGARCGSRSLRQRTSARSLDAASKSRLPGQHLAGAVSERPSFRASSQPFPESSEHLQPSPTILFARALLARRGAVDRHAPRRDSSRGDLDVSVPSCVHRHARRPLGEACLLSVFLFIQLAAGSSFWVLSRHGLTVRSPCTQETARMGGSSSRRVASPACSFEASASFAGSSHIHQPNQP